MQRLYFELNKSRRGNGSATQNGTPIEFIWYGVFRLRGVKDPKPETFEVRWCENQGALVLVVFEAILLVRAVT